MKIDAHSSNISAVSFPKKEEPKSEINYPESNLAEVLSEKVFLFCFSVQLKIVFLDVFFNIIKSEPLLGRLASGVL